jgi:hypothetical protein
VVLLANAIRESSGHRRIGLFPPYAAGIFLAEWNDRFMRIRLFFAAATVLLLTCFACDSKTTYPVTFTCGSTGGPSCPPGSECPALPLGPDTCGDLPGDPPTSVSVGRPLGCVVGLSYGNPFYGDSQQTCECTAEPGSPTGSTTPQWECPI